MMRKIIFATLSFFCIATSVSAQYQPKNTFGGFFPDPNIYQQRSGNYPAYGQNTANYPNYGYQQQNSSAYPTWQDPGTGYPNYGYQQQNSQVYSYGQGSGWGYQQANIPVNRSCGSVYQPAYQQVWDVIGYRQQPGYDQYGRTVIYTVPIYGWKTVRIR